MTVLRNDQFTVFLLKRNPNLPPPLPHHVFFVSFLFVCLFVCFFFVSCLCCCCCFFLGGGVVSLLFAVVVVFSFVFVFVFAGLRYFPKIRVQFIARDEFYEII